MNKRTLRDVIILVPGIMGSVLRTSKDIIWPPFDWSAARQAVFSRPDWIDSLRLDSASQSDVTPVGLVENASIFPGVGGNKGYGKTVQQISKHFNVIESAIGSTPGNFFQFAYDWRVDNVQTANRLAEFVRIVLPAWRAHSGASDAKVIFLAHSMGGLISRYFLEVMGGWTDSRALVTFGTPFRGSVKAIRSLHEGESKFGVDLTMVIRSLESIYQLLPIYPVVFADGAYKRVSEIEINGIDHQRAIDSLAFFRTLESAATDNAKDSSYKQSSYAFLPVVGTRQTTLQSASLSNGSLTFLTDIPNDIDISYNFGDGTVPRVSATPVEESNSHREIFLNGKHSSLQNHELLWELLPDWLQDLQGLNLQAVRGYLPSSQMKEISMSLDVDEVFRRDEQVVVHVSIGLESEIPNDATVSAELKKGTDNSTTVVSLKKTSDGFFIANLGLLQPEIYTVTVTATHAGLMLGSVTEVFWVSD